MTRVDSNHGKRAEKAGLAGCEEGGGGWMIDSKEGGML